MLYIYDELSYVFLLSVSDNQQRGDRIDKAFQLQHLMKVIMKMTREDLKKAIQDNKDTIEDLRQ